MINLRECRNILKNENKDKIILVKYGNFYRCFDDDSFIIFYLFNYKISDNYVVGFPINNLDKVLSKLRDNNISVIIIKDRNNYLYFNCNNNSYSSLLDKSKKYYNVVNATKIVNNIVENILFNNINKLHEILNFLKNI